MVTKTKRRWCAWCGDDIKKVSDRHSRHFCCRKCEREFWHDVYSTGEDLTIVAASLMQRDVLLEVAPS